MLAKNFISVLVSAGLGLIFSVLLNLLFDYSNPYWPYSILYYSVFCFVFNLIYAFNRKSKDLTGIMLAGIVIKLLLAFSIVFLYSMLELPNYFSFSVHFMVHYVLFTIFEIRYLLQLIKTTANHEKASVQ